MGVGHLTEWTHAYKQEETDLTFFSLQLSPKPEFIYLFPCLYISLLLSLNVSECLDLEPDSAAGVLVTMLPKHRRAGLILDHGRSCRTTATELYSGDRQKVATNSQLRSRWTKNK